MTSRGFLRRHRNKFVAVGVIVGGAYYTFKWSLTRLQQKLLQSTQEKLRTSQKIEHFLSIEQTSNTAIFDFIKYLNDQIKKMLPSEKILEELQYSSTKSINKYELWEELKIICLTKCAVSIYSLNLLILIIKIHLNVVGGYMYVINHETNKHVYTKELFNHQIQQEFLENIQNFIRKSLPKLIEKFKDYVKKSFKSVSLKEKLTITQLKHELNALFILPHDYLLNDFNTDSYKYAEAPNTSDQLLQNLNIEANDLISCQNCLDTFVVLNQQAINKFGHLLLNELKQDLGYPMAKLIPLMDKVYDQIIRHEDCTNQFVNELLSNEQLNAFSANIYEAFSFIQE